VVLGRMTVVTRGVLMMLGRLGVVLAGWMG
jgi:hypothetical protein